MWVREEMDYLIFQYSIYNLFLSSSDSSSSELDNSGSGGLQGLGPHQVIIDPADFVANSLWPIFLTQKLSGSVKVVKRYIPYLGESATSFTDKMSKAVFV